jgi:hypothetical protein
MHYKQGLPGDGVIAPAPVNAHKKIRGVWSMALVKKLKIFK